MKKILSLFLFFSFFFANKIYSMEWEYLWSKPFKARYAVAAYYLKDCDEIIEIGGYRTPIDQFVHKSKKVIVIDPLIESKTFGNVKHYGCTLKDFPKVFPKSKYGVVILGLLLHDMDKETTTYLYNLIQNSQVTVIGIPSSYPASVKQFKEILQHSHKKVTTTIGFDFSENTYPSSKNSWPPRTDRKLYVLE